MYITLDNKKWKPNYKVLNPPKCPFMTTVLYILSDSAPVQGAEGVPLTHGPESALHVQPPPAEDSGSDADDGQLVPVCMDGGCAAEPRQEHPGVRHNHHIGRAGV